MHIDPETVHSAETGVADIRVIYNAMESTEEPSWSLASLRWNGRAVLAARWNGDDRDDQSGVGDPQSRGVPTWFILPNHIAKLVRKNLPEDFETLPPLHSRVRLSPIPRRSWHGQPLAAPDHHWAVTELDAERRVLSLSNLSTGEKLRLWPEQVRSFIPDPMGPKYQPKTGQLTLSVQIIYQDGNMSLYPA